LRREVNQRWESHIFSPNVIWSQIFRNQTSSYSWKCENVNARKNVILLKPYAKLGSAWMLEALLKVWEQGVKEVRLVNH